MASILLMPNANGKALYSAKDALELYLKEGEDIFHSNLWDKLKRGNGLFDERYSSEALEKHLNNYFKSVTIDKFIKPCLLTAYEITSRKAQFFTKSDANDSLNNFYVRDVARATSAAPTYFEPALIRSLHDQEYALIDGGVFANNPALCAYAEVRKTRFPRGKQSKPGAKDMIIVSVGTGVVKEPYAYKDLKDAGQIKWLEPIIDILMSGNAETVDYQLTQMYDTLKPVDKKDYYRLEPSLREASTKMDLATTQNIDNLKQAGYWYVKEVDEILDEIAERVVVSML